MTERGAIKLPHPKMGPMVGIPFPEGTTRYSVDLDGDKPESHFGASSIYIRTNVSDHVGGVVDSTIIRYDPGDLLITIGRQDLTAEEINKIGLLSSDIMATTALIWFVNKVRAQVESISGDLIPVLAGRPETGDETTGPRQRAAKLIANFGVIANELEESRPRANKESNDLVRKLDHLGVIVVDHLMGRSEVYGQGFPIKKMAQILEPEVTELTK